MQNVFFINQIILLDEELTKVFKDLCQDFKHFLLDLLAACL